MRRTRNVAGRLRIDERCHAEARREYWQQKFVDLYTKYEAAKALTYNACAAYNEDKFVNQGMLSMETTRIVSSDSVVA